MNENQLHWVGVDVAKQSFDAAIVFAGQRVSTSPLREVPASTFIRSPHGVTAFIAWLDTFGLPGDSARVIMETTGRFSQELCAWMCQQRPSLAPAIEPAQHTANFIRSLGLRAKTDRMEARALAFYGIERIPEPYTPPAPEYLELRQLSRYRDDLVHQQTMLKNQLHETTTLPFIRREQQKRLRRIANDIARTEKCLKECAEKHLQIKHDITLLSSICGIAFLSAVTLLAELGDLRRFGRARQLTAYAGLSPRHYQSGTSVHRHPRICKQGNSKVRQLLYLCAMAAVRGDNDFGRTYKRLLAQGKLKMVALIAIMRKMLILARAILISGKTFQPMGITR